MDRFGAFFSQPISWLSTEETKFTTTKSNNTRTKWQKHSQSKLEFKENLNL